MADRKDRLALIVGAGSGLSASLARAFAGAGNRIALAARSVGKPDGLCAETGASAFACDATKPKEVDDLFRRVDGLTDPLDAVVFNAGYRTRGPIAELDPAEVEKTLMVSAFAGFLVGQQAARRGSLPRRASTSRISSSTAASAAPSVRTTRKNRMRCSTRMRLRNPISPWSTSRGAPGPGRSSSGPGSRLFEGEQEQDVGRHANA